MKNITIKQYSDLADVSAYDLLLSLQPKNSFQGRTMDINTMPYANVRYSLRLISKISNWQTVQQLFSICFDVTEQEFWAAPIHEYFAALRYLIHAFEQCVANENKLMSSNNQDAHLWQMAGGDRLRSFADTLPLIHLSKMFGMYPYDIGRKPYSEVFTLMIATRTQQEVENEFTKLKYSTKS